MKQRFSRTELLLGEKGMERLYHSHIAVFGVGGVGGHAAEALVRSGIGEITIIDNDRVSISNLNRQIIADMNSIGRLKVEVMKERILTIQPEIKVHTISCFVLPETMGEIPFAQFDYIVDAVDTVTAKLAIIEKARELKIPVISSMGTGNKLDPSKLTVTDIYKTEGCPLAKVMRKECRERGIQKLKVVYSRELPRKPDPEAMLAVMAQEAEEGMTTKKKAIPASNAFVPASAGLMIASEVVCDISGVR